MSEAIHVDELSGRDLVRLVTEYLEGALPAEDARRFEAHLDRCPGLQAHMERMRVTLLVLGCLCERHIPAALQARLLEVFRGWPRRPVPSA